MFSIAFAQINLTTNPDVLNIPNGTPFLDASSAYDERNVGDNNIGKGLVFPRVDLINFEFNTDQPDGANVLPTYYDGMIVYNVGSGTTLTGEKRSSTPTAVTPGFYYFYNPNTPDSVTTGKWIRIDGGASTSVATGNVATGTFNHDGSTKAILGNMPTDLKAITSIKIARIDDNGALLEGGVVSTTFYSYDKATKTIAFGQGAMSTSMPKGNYSYTIEYTK